MRRAPDDPFRPILWSIVMAIVLVGAVLWLSACTTPPEAPTSEAASKPAFPKDMRVVCYQGAYWIGSVSADQVVRLPLSCS